MLAIEFQRLPRTIALWSFFVLALLVTCVITLLIHEAGHARACIALGGNVGGFGHWLRGVLVTNPSTDCSIKPFPAGVWGAGPVISIVAWFVSALTIIALLNRAVIKRGVCGSILWGWWCFWNLWTLLREVFHAYAPPSVWQDSTQFVHVTGVNPNLVGIPLAVILTFRSQYGA